MFILDPEMMKKTFLMGENGTNFTHKSAQHIKLFPFTANNTATIITSFSAVIGEWLRLACNQNKVPESMEATLSKLADSMDDIGAYEKEQLLQIARSIYWDDDEKHSLRPKSITTMCYIPCDDQTALKTAQYLYSVLADNENLSNVVNQAAEHAIKEVNVLEKAVFEALQAKIEPLAPIDPYYIVHLAPQKIFMKDLKFILKNTARTKEYLVDLLEFYHFFYTSQTCLALSRFEHGDRYEIVPLYFSLDWERTNKARECYRSGWQQLLPAIKQQFYHAVTLEILNQNPTGEQFDYIALRDYVEKTGMEEEVATQIRCVCDLYRNAISDCSELNDLQKNEQLGTVFSEVNYLYESVRTQFRNTGRSRVSDGYVKHFETFCHDRFLKSRGASGLMLNITEEFLIFLTKLAIHDEEKLSLNEVFRQFELRGVFLDQPSKDEVVQFYTKLNLIEKKSDSGDAQYVRRIL